MFYKCFFDTIIDTNTLQMFFLTCFVSCRIFLPISAITMGCNDFRSLPGFDPLALTFRENSVIFLFLHYLQEYVFEEQ